jgi:UDPglucose 6-dehydrogenase
MRPKFGVIGFGFLGRALVHGFSLHADIKIYDKYDNIYNSLRETVDKSVFIFIGVPTPMAEDGSQDLKNVYDAVESVISVARTRKTIILRSTIIPGTTRKLANKYPDHDFVFFPEFLTERSAKLDFINASRIIFGGEYIPCSTLRKVFRKRFPHTPFYLTTWEGAEMAKYMANSFFAVKISFLNEMYDVAKHLGVNYDDLRNMLLADGRVGNSHADVPGHDGDRGYGGKCFPKDVQAFIKWADKSNLHLDVCEAAEKVNRRVRNSKNWLDIKGATSENNYEKGEK